jgi:hypothetical protein
MAMALTDTILKIKLRLVNFILRSWAILFACFLFQTTSYALTADRNVCSNKATLGQWQIGILAKYDVQNIVDEFGTIEKKDLIKSLNELPVVVSEKFVLEILKEKPTQRISVISNSPQLYWDLSQEKVNLRVSIQFYEGCISRIGIYDPRTRNTFIRTNNLRM